MAIRVRYLLGGVEDILGGYVKKSEPLRGEYQNISRRLSKPRGVRKKKLTFIIMLNIECIYIQI